LKYFFGKSSRGLWLKYLILFLFVSPVFAQQNQNTEASRRDVIRYGTETEIASLIQSLRTENADYLDEELIEVAQTSGNQRILTGIFGFFGERGKNGLEERAVKAINNRDYETNETVHSAIEYLGRVKSSDAVPAIIDLLDTEERRFLNTGFRALGRAASADRNSADTAADFIIDFYNNREPGQENQREMLIAIGETGSANGIELLSEIATNEDERVPLRTAALEALSKIGNSKGLDAILSCVNTNDPNVRSAAVGALGPFSSGAVDSAILEAFRDSFFRTRIAAAQASRDRRLAAAVPYLKFRAERDEVPNVRDEAIRALGEIGSAEAVQALESLFSERRNSDRIRILAADMLMKNASDENYKKLLEEMEEARRRNHTTLLNGLLRVAGETILYGDKTDMENLVRRFMQGTVVIERLYALDMIANNNLTGFEAEINNMTQDRNEGIARKAQRTLDILEEYKSGRRQRETQRPAPRAQRQYDEENQ